MCDSLWADKPPQYFTKPARPTQPPTPVEREMSTSQSEVTFCGPGVNAAYSTSDERLPERLRDDLLIISGVQIRFILAVWYL